MKDCAQSVLDRLKSIFKKTGEGFQDILLQYAMERFLFRLSKSSNRERFILKGGILFYIWTDKKFRPTKDLDFAYFGDFIKTAMFDEVQSICSIEYPEDGLTFSDFKATEIKEDHGYEGVRVTFNAWLKKVRIPMQLDISTGDKITPGTESIRFPKLLKMDAPELQIYPKETVFAEKFEAMVKLDIKTSRMKDIYDLYILISEFGQTFDPETLSKAIKTTFTHRNTELPTSPVKVFSAYFYEDSGKLAQWKAFINKTTEDGLTLKEACMVISDFIEKSQLY